MSERLEYLSYNSRTVHVAYRRYNNR